jgi:Arc/MetJ-type ribon-helix-helix transcriptional regulator
VPARTAASVVQIWSIAAETCANLQAPWRTHKPLIRLGFRCPVVPGRRPEGPLERTFNPLVRGSSPRRPTNRIASPARPRETAYTSRQASWREPIPRPNTMKTLEIEIPDQLGRQIEELVRRGWFTDENDLARQALGDFLRHHRLELQEQHQLDDIEWARRLKEQAG